MDVVGAVQALPPSSALARDELGDTWDWNHLAANMAELVDLMHFWLHSEYAKWIYDPESPEAKAEAKRRKPKPPSSPIIPPVAHRPPSVAEKYIENYLDRVQLVGDVKSVSPQAIAGKRAVTSAEFDQVLQLL